MSKKAKNSVWRYVYDHYIAIFGAVIGLIGLGFLYALRDAALDFIKWSYSGWIVCGVIIATLLIRKLLSKRESVSGGVVTVYRPPGYKHEEYEPIEKYGVNWHFWRGSNVPSAFDYALGDTQLITWVDGPYCIKCEYELEQSGKHDTWICAEHNPVKIPESLRGDVRHRMIKAFDADLRKQQKENQK